MRNKELANEIWKRHMANRSRGRRALGVSVSVAAVSAVVAATALWPRPAYAFQDVVKASMKFRTISWKQLDEGIVRDMGSPNPKNVPAFSQTIHHYASIDPPDIQQRKEPSKTWMGMYKFTLPVPFKQPDGSTKMVQSPGFGYRPGPSKGITVDDLRWEIGQFISYQGHFREGDPVEEVQYKGRPAIKFHYRKEEKWLVREDTVIADKETKRMLYRRFAVSRDGKVVFLREQTDIVYDGARPK